MLKVTVSESGNLLKHLRELSQRAQELDGQHEMTLGELMSGDFVAGCSKFGNLQELFNASGFSLETAEEFQAVPDNEWDAFIATNTSYHSWAEMKSAAVREWARKKLGLA